MAGRFLGKSLFSLLKKGNALQAQVRGLASRTSTPIVSRTGLPYISPGFDFGRPPFGADWGQPVTIGRDGLPESVNWTKVPGAVHAARDQGNNGLCTAFGTLGSISSLFFLEHKLPVVLSVQQVWDCNTLTNDGTHGAMPFDVADFVVSNGGIMLENLYPYVRVQGQCKRIKGQGVSIGSWHFVEPNSEKALKYALCYQPVVVSIRTECPMYVNGGPILFDTYKDGIIKGCSYKTDQLDHCVLCVGYDKDAMGNLYWILLNSYSVFWGKNGLFWLRRGGRQPGGALGILRMPLIPLDSSAAEVLARCEGCPRCF